jgi:hypothetical protein
LKLADVARKDVTSSSAKASTTTWMRPPRGGVTARLAARRADIVALWGVSLVVRDALHKEPAEPGGAASGVGAILR